MAIEVETYAIRLPVFYAPKAAARALGIGEKTIYDLINSGRLRAVRTSPNRWKIPAEALDEFANSNSGSKPELAVPVATKGRGNGAH